MGVLEQYESGSGRRISPTETSPNQSNAVTLLQYTYRLKIIKFVVYKISKTKLYTILSTILFVRRSSFSADTKLPMRTYCRAHRVKYRVFLRVVGKQHRCKIPPFAAFGAS